MGGGPVLQGPVHARLADHGGTWLLAPSFRFLYYYPASEQALRILAIGIVFMFVNNAFIGTLNAIDRQSSFTWAALWSMVVNVGLNLIVIPLFGYIGASWATVVTEIALGIFGWILVARHLTRLPCTSSAGDRCSQGASWGPSSFRSST